MDDLSLPAGLSARALALDDARAVYEVMALQEEEDLGKVESEAADIVADWQRPSFDVAASTVGVFDAGTMVAYAEVSPSGRGAAAVHPAYRRRGIGTALAEWMPVRTRAMGGAVIGSLCPRVPRVTGSWRSSAGTSAGPAGCWPCPRAPRSSNAASPTATRSALPRPTSTPRSRTSSRTPFSNGRCATASRTRTLLVDAFARGREHGATRSALSTDSRTGALALYERVGMEVGDVWLHRAVDV